MQIFGFHRKALVRFLGVLLPALLLAGCGGGDDGDRTGTVGVSLTDAPACGFEEVNVTVRQVRFHANSAAPDAAAGWVDINLNPPRKINLLDLTNGVLEGLGEAPVGAGQYTQVRLVLAANSGGSFANSIVLENTTTEIPIDTPSGVQSGIKLIHPFYVRPDQRTDLLLDFDACKSIVARGNGSYALKPVIEVIPFVQNGIRGVIDPAFLASHVVVSAQQGGEVIRSTVPNPVTGEFFLARFESGTYDLVVTADDHATAVITSVPVANDAFIAVAGTLAQPITLEPSAAHTLTGTVTLNPASTTETVAFVTAKQALGNGVTVTVKTKSAELMGGDYSLTLPAEASWVGPYGTGTLPISLTPVPGAAGEYAIEASAEGYATESVDKDVSSADATQNFILAP